MRRALAVAAVLVVAVACSDPPESPWAIDATTPPSTPAASTDTGDERSTPTTPRAPSANPDAEIADDECLDGEDRCGRVLVPALAGSADRAALGFRLYAPEAQGRPLVVLESGFGDFAPTPDDFPGRPIVVLGARSLWPGGPTMSCPEWYDVTADDPDAVVLAATSACIDRIADAGVPIEGTLREQDAADVVAALAAFGIDGFDIVAAHLRADAVPAIAAELTVERRVLVEPSLAPADPVVRSLQRTAQALDYAWEACRTDPQCAPTDTLDDFLDRIADLDASPITFTEPFSGEQREVDTEWMVSALQRELDAPETIGFLPAIHEALRTRDADTIAEFLSAGGGGSVTTEWLAPSCARAHASEADVASFHPALRADAIEGLAFFALHCPLWYDGVAEEAPHEPGLVILSASSPDAERLAGLGDPLVIQNTIGSPTHACVVDAVRDYLHAEAVDAPACAEPYRLVDRSAIDLVPGTYVVDGRQVTLLVPDAWTDSGQGTWWRDDGPLDLTNLDVYAFAADALEQARNDFVAEWAVTDARLSERRLGGRQWLFAIGGDEFDPVGDVRQVIAAAQYDGWVVVVILQTTEDELDTLLRDVLEPALDATELD